MSSSFLKIGALVAFVVLLVALKVVVTYSSDKVTITENVLCSEFLGFGTEFNPFIHTYTNEAFVQEADMETLESLVEELRPQLVRIFIYLNWWRNGEKDMLSSLERTLQLAKQVGADVHLTVSGGWSAPLYVESSWGTTALETAIALHSLVTEKGFTNIKYINIGNEPNTTQQGPEAHVGLHLALDKALRNFGLREQIKIMAGDITAAGRDAWLPYLGENLGNVLDSYSVHIYWNYWDSTKDYIPKLSGIRDIISPSARKPVLVMEFGNRGKRGPDSSGDPGIDLEEVHMSDSPIAAFELSMFMLQALKHGMSGMSKWEAWDGYYKDMKRFIHHGLVGISDGQWKPKPSYELYMLFTRSTRRGWEVRDVATKNSNITSVAMNGDDECTIFLRNESGKMGKVTVEGLPENSTMHSYSFTLIPSSAPGIKSTWRGGLKEGKEVGATDARGRITIEIPGQTLLVLTTLNIAEE